MTQPTASSQTTAAALSDTAECVSPDEIKEYLSGWSGELQSERIESHLAGCPACEQALRDLEIKPDTLMQSLQGTAVEVIQRQSDSAAMPQADQPFHAALAGARQLMDVPTESSRLAWQPPNRELGVYELLRPLGRGGMGAVYLATHRQLNKQVAIKLLPMMSTEDSDVRARFQREIRVVGRLNHPSIVTATDAGEIEGTQFLVMEYVSGMDLSRLARLLGRLPVAEACELMRQTALGLSCAHAEGVVHRDVKPSNLMLDEAGRIKILDFGLAQLSVWDEASVDLTTVGQLMGTLDYMAPEQAELAGGVDYRADLFAMGATLFRLLCGRPPLAAAPNQSPLEKLRLLANHEPPKLNTLCPDAPDELVALVGSMLARSPQDRPASAAHVAESLVAFTKSADLAGLLRNARDVEAQSPELVPRFSKPWEAMKPGFVAEKKSGVFESPGVQAGSDAADSRNRRRRWFIAASILPLLILAGILIRLETQKGQLVIESEVDNLKVSIVSEGQPVSGLVVKHGTTATRLRADKYEIVIDGPSDGLVIDNDRFTIQNGETVVARIHIDASPESPIPSVPGNAYPAATAANSSKESLYDGKSLSEWLDMLSREKSPAGLKSAFDACYALASSETSERITQTLLSVLPKLDGELNLTPRETASHTLDQEAVKVLWKANKGAPFYSLWVREFEAADEKWRARLWHYCLYDFQNIETIEPFVVWAERRLSQAPSGTKTIDADTVKAADYLRAEYLRSVPGSLTDNQSAIDRIYGVLKNSPHLGTVWWLSQPLVHRTFGQGNRYIGDFGLWPPAIRMEMVRTAIAILDSDDSSPSLLAQACIILAHGSELEPQQKTVVLAAVNRRLVTACETEKTLTSMVKTEDAFARFSMPEIAMKSSFSTLPIRIELQGNDSRVCVVLELLDVVTNLDGAASVTEGLSAVTKSTRSTLELVSNKQALVQRENENRPDLSFGNLAILNWPVLQVSDAGMSISGFGSPASLPPGKDSRAMQQLWGDHQPSSEDWLKYCMLLHPAMEASLTAITKETESSISFTAKKSEAPESTPVVPAQTMTEPVYEGKTLQQWLEVIQKERSPEHFLAAIKACSTLVTPESSSRVSQVLLEVLPKINGIETIHDSNDTVGLIDSVAFEVIAKASPGRAWFEVLATQHKSPDVAWRQRLKRQLRRGDQSKFENVEPLVRWAERELREPSQDPRLQSTADAAQILKLFLGKFTENREFTESALETLRNCPALGPEWWLALPMPSQKPADPNGDPMSDFNAAHDASRYGVLPAVLFQEVTKRAIVALEESETSPSHVAQASMILANSVGMTDEQTGPIIAAVNRRLIELAKSEKSMTELVDVEPAFAATTVPTPAANTVPIRCVYLGGPATQACVTLELLDLFQNLKGELTPSDGVASIAQVLVDVQRPKNDGGRLEFTWPELHNRNPERAELGGIFGGPLRELEPAEIMKLLIDSHPAVVEFRTSATNRNK